MQPVPQPADPLIGQVVAGRYRVLELLGEGGMGRVYLAEHVAIQKRMALKVLRGEYAHKGDMVSRFQQEAISASRIKHPNVLDVFDFGQIENGCFYLAMEYLEGNDLADELLRRRVLEAPAALRIALQVCRALGAAHKSGVVHRDLKPENVFLQRSSDGEDIVKIVDFGIAQLRTNAEAAAESKHRRLTKTGMIFGTPEYMAPEQAEGLHADQRADVYALGVMLYEMFTGAVPFTGETFLSVLAKHLNENPPALTAVAPDLRISPQLQGVIMKALAKRPNERYASMAELAQALQATPEGVLAQQPSSAISASREGGFVPAQANNPTAPEFGVVSGPGTAAAGSVDRGAATLARGSGEPPDTRAETPLATEASSAPRATKAGSRNALFALAAVVLLAGSAWALSRSSASSRDTETDAASHERTPAAINKTEAEARPREAEAAPAKGTTQTAPPGSAAGAAHGNSSVRLEVISDPPGATLSKNGFQVCDATPCEVFASANETLELSAVKGPLRAQVKVLAQRDQKVRMALSKPAKVAKAPSSGPRMCEVDVDGLKILRPCP